VWYYEGGKVGEDLWGQSTEKEDERTTEEVNAHEFKGEGYGCRVIWGKKSSRTNDIA
jgi:hypothetical protein